MTGTSLWTPARHPLARLLRDLASTSTHANPGMVTRVTPWAQPLQGTLTFSGHCVMAVSYDFSDAQLADMQANTLEGAQNPRVITQLAGATGWIDTPRVVLLGAGTASGDSDSRLVSRNDLGQLPAVHYAKRVHQEVQVFGEANHAERHVITLGRGLGGAREIVVAHDVQHPSVQVHDLVAQALACIPANELTVTCVPVGDAVSIAEHQAAGMRAVGAVQLFSSRPETAPTTS